MPDTKTISTEEKAIKFGLKPGARISGDPEEIGRALLDIKEKNGTLTPDGILEEARDPDHTLHPHFTWDDELAAEKQRKREARKIVQSVIIREVDDQDVSDKNVRAFVSVDDGEQQGYEETAVALSQEPSRSNILSRARRDLRRFRERYNHLEELAGIINKINSLLDE